MHFENIIYDDENFTFLDWRQDFAGIINYGDVYYDLSKIFHGILVSHPEIIKGNFKVKWNNNKINFSIKKNKNLRQINNKFMKWLKTNSYDIQKVKVITSLIFLNISPLHHYPYNLFLYSFGKSMLFNCLNNNKIRFLKI